MEGWKSTRGGITVFQCLLFLALLAMTGLLLDAARIMAAERRVQEALNAAVRSTLAGYDSELAGECGIFALEDRAGALEAEFLRYLGANLRSAGGTEWVRYGILAEGTSVAGESSLLHQERFKEQILAYMKYKAPMTVTASIIDKFAASDLLGKIQFSQSERTVREKRGSVKDTVGRANRQIGVLNDNIRTVNRDRSKKNPDELQKITAALEVLQNELTAVADGLEDYAGVKQKSDEIAAASGFAPTETEFSTALKEAESIKSQCEKIRAEIDGFIQKIRPILAELESCEKELENLRISNVLLVNRLTAALLLGDSGEAEAIRREMEWNSRAMQRLQERIGACGAQLDAARDAFQLEALNTLTDREPENDTEEKPAEGGTQKGTDGILEEIRVKFGDYLGDIREEWKISEEEIADAQEAGRQEYAALLSKSMESGKVVSEREDAQEAELKNSSFLAFLSGMMDQFRDIAENGMEKLYITEYIMDKFTYLTAKAEREHFFRKGEAEYVLWGDNKQLVNISKTIGLMGFLRFAVDAVDFFATSKNPHPLFRLIYAVGRGAVQAVLDMSRLCGGKPVSFSPSFKACQLTYGDHLRVFLLLQPEDAQLNNIKQLIQVNLKQADAAKALKDYRTVLYARAAVRINLWFIPLLRPDKLSIRGFEAGGYVIRKEMYMGY